MADSVTGSQPHFLTPDQQAEARRLMADVSAARAPYESAHFMAQSAAQARNGHDQEAGRLRGELARREAAGEPAAVLGYLRAAAKLEEARAAAAGRESDDIGRTLPKLKAAWDAAEKRLAKFKRRLRSPERGLMADVLTAIQGE